MFPTVRLFLAAGFTAIILIGGAMAQNSKASDPPNFFPYEVKTKTLANGLTIIVIPTPEFKDMVTYSTAVFAGSRNETEKGKTGLAHLFEHIMFRHEIGGQPGGYSDAIRRMGAHNNAWTDYDLTFYHPTTFSENLFGPINRPGGPLPGLIELEASRFMNLTLPRKTFEVEAGAVLGEYRKIFSDPAQKAVEDLSPVAFPHHPYGHTVIGYRDDVENMPNAWDSAWEFYHNYYAPNDVAVIAVGDVDPAKIFAEAEKRYADWKPSHPPQIPAESAPDGPKQVHVKWEADVSPRLFIG
jgi:zinc protease